MPFPSLDTQTAAPGLRRSTSPACRWGPALAVSALLSAVLSLLVLAACTGGGVTAPQTGTPTPQVGSIVVTVSTAGGPAPTVYAVTVDTQPAQPAPANGVVVFTALPAGPHQVALSELPTNCAVGGVNPRTVSVSVGDTARTTFAVTCTAAATATSAPSRSEGRGRPSGAPNLSRRLLGVAGRALTECRLACQGVSPPAWRPRPESAAPAAIRGPALATPTGGGISTRS